MYRRKLTYYWLPLILMRCFTLPVFSQNVHLQVPLTLSDHQKHKTMLYFGVHPAATACIDPTLGEFELPADHCGTSALCAYFIDPPLDTTGCFGAGLLLDLRKYSAPDQVDTYQVVFSTQDFPVTFYWQKDLNAYYDSIFISSGITGAGISASMISAESLVVNNATIERILITAYHPRGVLSAVKERSPLPRENRLFPNYPNPFNPSTMIRYTLARASRVTLRVYDINGNAVATLVHDQQAPGEHNVEWKPNHVPSGVYYCRMETSEGVLAQSMMLVR